MRGKPILFVDQYGQHVIARTLLELKSKVGCSRARKVYRDKADGRTVHVGYSLGQRWFDMYQPLELAA